MNDDQEETDESEEDEGYLHPFLRSSNRSNQDSIANYNSFNNLIKNNSTNGSNNSRPTNSLYSKLAENLKDTIVVNDKSYFEPKVIESKSVKYDVAKKSSDHLNSKNVKQDKLIRTNQVKAQQSVFDLIPEVPVEIKIIIEKLAQYVVKNGDEFEKTIKSRNENRFEFLNPGHKFHFYYVKTKLNLLEEKRKQSELIDNKSSTANSSAKLINNNSLENSSSNSTNDLLNDNNKTISPFTILTSKKSTSFKDDLAAKQLKEKQEERKRKAALFLNKLKLQKGTTDEEKSIKGQLIEDERTDKIIGPQLPFDQKESLRNTPSPLREFFDDLDIKTIDKERKSTSLPVFDELRISSKDKLSSSVTPEKDLDQTSFKKSTIKSKQFRIRENSSSSSNAKRSNSIDRHSKSSNHKHRRTRSRSKSSRRRSRSRSNHHKSRHSRRRSRSRSRSVKRRRKSHRSRERRSRDKSRERRSKERSSRHERRRS